MARALAMFVTIAAAPVLVTLAAPQAGADPQPQTVTYAIGKCVSPEQPPEQKPARFDYNCDGTGVLQDMTWTSWNAYGAEGTGTDVSIECKPNCAQGSKLTNPVVVRASTPRRATNADCPPAIGFYSELTIAYPKGAPPWISPGTTWDVGTDFVTVDGMPAVKFSDLKPTCAPR